MTVKVTKPAVNLREELADLRKPTGIAGEAMLRAETPQEQFNLIGAGRRNILINGDMQIAQRGSSGQSTSDAFGAYLSLDRWSVYYSATTLSREDSIYINNQYKKALKVDAGSTDGRCYVYQKIENGSSILGGGQPFSLSFWAKSTTGVTMEIGYRYYDNATENNGVTGSIAAEKDFTITSEWKYYKFEGLVALDTSQDSTRDFGLWFQPTGASAADGTGDDFWLTEVQLELGKVATPFEHRSYGDELQRCQRYYQFLGGTHYQGLGVGFHYQAGQTTFATISYPNEMRASPSVSIRGTIISTDRIGFNDDVTSITSTEAGKTSLYTRFNTGTSRTDRMPLLIKVKPNTTSGIQLDAEL